MKKKALFLAAAAAAVIGGGIFANPANAAEAGHMNKSNTDEVLLDALMNHATITMKDGALPLVESEGQSGPDLGGDFSMVRSIEFECTLGNPLEGVRDWKSIEYFSGLELLDLCSAEGVDWASLAKIPSLKTLGIYPSTPIPEDYFLNGGTSTDLSGIEALTGLETLSIMNTPIYDLSHIEDLSNLKRISLYEDGLWNVDGLSKLNNLESFYFPLNNIQNVLPIAEKAGIAGDSISETYQMLMEAGVPYIYRNTWYLDAKKDVPYGFKGDVDYLNNYIFSSNYLISAEGVSIDNEAKTVTLTEDMGVIEFGVNGANSYKLKLIVNDNSDDAGGDSTDNPETLDHSMLGWAMGLAAAIIAGTSVTFFVRSRR